MNTPQFTLILFLVGDKALEIQQEKVTSGAAEETAAEKEKVAEEENESARVSTEKRKQEKRARGRPRKKDKTKPARRKKTECAFSIRGIGSFTPQLVVQSAKLMLLV